MYEIERPPPARASAYDIAGAMDSYRPAQYRGTGSAGLCCRGWGVPIRVLRLGDACDQCSRWEIAQRLILRANQLLEGVR